MNHKETKDLVKVDVDLIKQLRFEGEHDTANRLLEAFHESRKKAGKQAKNDYLRLVREYKLMKKICVADGCGNPMMEGSTYCEHHYEQKRKHNQKRIQKMKEVKG